MVSVKELAKWLEEEVEFLKENQDYVGGWYDLGGGLAATVLWEEGWGDEIRDDAIQATNNPDWGLCAGILVYNKDDTPDGWYMPWDSKTGDIICETTGIKPNEDYERLAKWLLDDFNRVKDAEIKQDGETIFHDEDENKGNPYDPEKLPDEGMSKEEIEAKEKSLKEEKESSSLTLTYEVDSNFVKRCNEINDAEHNETMSEMIGEYEDGCYVYFDAFDEDDGGYCQYVLYDKDGRELGFTDPLNDDEVIDEFELDDTHNLIVKVGRKKKVKEAEESCKEEEKKKTIKESKEYSTSPYKDIIAEHFEYDGDFEFLDIIASIIGRIDDFTSDEDIWQAIDDELIYTYDQWKVLEHYCTPQDANWEDALDNLSGDIFAIASTIAGNQEDVEIDDDEIDDEIQEESLTEGKLKDYKGFKYEKVTLGKDDGYVFDGIEVYKLYDENGDMETECDSLEELKKIVDDRIELGYWAY